MRICLVNPASTFMVSDRVFPPLGLLRVAAVLRDAGFDVVVADGTQPEEADVYGIGATTAQMPATVAMLPLGSRTILGGAHATMVATAARRGSARGRALLQGLLRRFDTVVAGDGEVAVLEALRGRDGLLDADDLKSPWYVQDQDALPLPARDLIDLGAYQYEIDGRPATSLVSQLGCPFGCAFCGGRYSPFYRKIRNRSVDSVIREVEALVAQGYEGLMFLDDELNVSRAMLDLMRRLKPFGLALRGPVKASLFTQEQADAMAEAGFREVLFGFESGHDRILKAMQKGTVADNTRAFRIARAAGMRVKALMSLGHPGESFETAHATRDWLLEMKPDAFDVTVITPYPGTPYWDDAVRDGDRWTFWAKTGARLHQVDTDYEREPNYYKGIPGEYVSYVYTDFLTRQDLVTVRDRIEAEVREALSLPWPGKSWEHSMGQSA